MKKEIKNDAVVSLVVAALVAVVASIWPEAAHAFIQYNWDFLGSVFALVWDKLWFFGATFLITRFLLSVYRRLAKQYEITPAQSLLVGCVMAAGLVVGWFGGGLQGVATGVALYGVALLAISFFARSR